MSLSLCVRFFLPKATHPKRHLIIQTLPLWPGGDRAGRATAATIPQKRCSWCDGHRDHRAGHRAALWIRFAEHPHPLDMRVRGLHYLPIWTSWRPCACIHRSQLPSLLQVLICSQSGLASATRSSTPPSTTAGAAAGESHQPRCKGRICHTTGPSLLVERQRAAPLAQSPQKGPPWISRAGHVP